MIKTFTFLFDKWIQPIFFWTISIALVITSSLINNNLLSNVSLFVLSVALIGLAASAIYQFFNKRWLKGVLTGLLFCGTIFEFILYGILVFVIETVDGDKWADNLTIPSNIQLDEPLALTNDFKRPASMLEITKTTTDLQLYKSFQPGLYEYDFWTGRIENGTIYLKAYEITQEYALSTNRLRERSSVKIYNKTDSIVKFGTKTDFTIYEGDWGKPYAARFEVWFKPDNDDEERKLFEKNYKIEGWMR